MQSLTSSPLKTGTRRAPCWKQKDIEKNIEKLLRSLLSSRGKRMKWLLRSRKRKKISKKQEWRELCQRPRNMHQSSTKTQRKNKKYAPKFNKDTKVNLDMSMWITHNYTKEEQEEYAPKLELAPYEAPKYEAPKYEAPKYEAPKYEEPTTTAYEVPAYSTTTYEAVTTYEEPATEEPKYEEPAKY